MYQVAFVPTLASPWTEMEAVRLGPVLTGLQSPDGFLTIARDGEPRLRVDVYAAGNPLEHEGDFRVWNRCIVLGWGQHFYFVNPETHATSSQDLGAEFVQMHPGPEYLLVTTLERVNRIDPDGKVVWVSDELGSERVTIDTVDDGIVFGSGEWNPPGARRRFTISLETGQLE